MICCDMICCDMIWYDVMWWHVMWFVVLWYDMIWYDMMYYEVITCNVMCCDVLCYHITWFVAMLCDVMWCVALWCVVHASSGWLDVQVVFFCSDHCDVNVYVCIFLWIGTVPVYWGDDKLLKALMPHPMSVIFVADFDHNIEKLSKYLTYLSTNESAYEEHREWRQTFNQTKHVQDNIHLRDTWYCRTCMWAVKAMEHRKNETAQQENDRKNLILARDDCDQLTS